jgi:acetyl-CoA carboxylase alpha subunit
MIDIKTIKEKVRGKVNSLDRKTLSLISIAATVAVLGAGYMIFGKENGYAGVAKAEAPLTVSAITVEPRVIDTVVTEPTGGAHRDPPAAIAAIGEAIGNALEELRGLDRATVRRQRREKFLAMGRNMGKAAG